MPTTTYEGCGCCDDVCCCPTPPPSRQYTATVTGLFYADGTPFAGGLCDCLLGWALTLSHCVTGGGDEVWFGQAPAGGPCVNNPEDVNWGWTLYILPEGCVLTLGLGVDIGCGLPFTCVASNAGPVCRDSGLTDGGEVYSCGPYHAKFRLYYGAFEVCKPPCPGWPAADTYIEIEIVEV